MDRQKSRKGHESRRFTCDGFDSSINGRDSSYNEKSKFKRQVPSDKKYEMSPNSYLMNCPPQTRMHTIAQRQFSTSDSSVCHYSVPLSFSFEPVSLPICSAFIQPQGNCHVPLEIEPHSNRSKHHKMYTKSRRNKTNLIDQNEVPAIFQTPRINIGDQQDYTSLPPVNCDMYAAKTSDTEAACKRRFSDPGIGQVSSDDCSSIRSANSSNSSVTAEAHTQDFFSLVEQINELKECNSHLKRELHETKLELETIKIQSQTWRTSCEDFKPGGLSEAISEIRTAVKLGEEALISKVMQMLKKNSMEYKEAQDKLEEKLKEEIHERLSKLEIPMNKTSERETIQEIPENPETPLQDSAVQQQLIELEQEKFQLRKELQEAVAKRKEAEATTGKLERLVGILRKKINGVSLESCIPDEKHIQVRPLASSFEKNPFIIANNKQGQKPDTLPFSKPKIAPFRAFPAENPEGTHPAANENKENESGQGGGEGSASPGTNSATEGPAVTAQVTMTGPVTDL